MKRTLIILGALGLSLFFTTFYSCKKSKNATQELKLDCLNAYLDTMQHMIDTAKVGETDGTFPKSNYDDLVKAVDDVKSGISKAKAGILVLPFEVNTYCISASKAIASFKNSYQMTLSPGTSAELEVYGIDQKGHIEFGESSSFSASSSFTVESWLKYNPGFFEFAIADFIATFSTSSTGVTQGWMINFMGSNLRTTLGVGPQTGRVYEWGSLFPTNYGQWNHIVTVYDESLSSDQLKMYVNGELFFSKTNDVKDNSNVLQKYQPNTTNLKMWAFMEPSDNNRCMTGYMKKFRLWSTAKSQAEVKALMNADVQGNETNLICAWDFTKVPTNKSNIPDKTGKFSAKIVGQHKWHKL